MSQLMSPSVLALVAAVFIAAAVEVVEAMTIVLAMGLTRGWKATIVGMVMAFLALTVVVMALGVALTGYVSESLLQFVVGTLLLIFGLQWLRKAILRASGLKAVHDEDLIFKKQQEAAMQASKEQRFGLDWFAFVVSFKGVFLEGMEVVFIVLTFGLGAQAKHVHHAIAIASAGAALAAAVVVTAGVIARHPLSRVPENTMKYVVGLLLSTFGTFWTMEGMGYFGPAHTSLEWPTGEWGILILLAAWLVVTQVAIAVLTRKTRLLEQGAAPVAQEVAAGPLDRQGGAQ